MNTTKIKQVAFIGGVALVALLLVNTLAKRSATVARVRDTVNNGL